MGRDQNIHILISDTDDEQDESADRLWALLLDYYRPRIDFHVRELWTFMQSKVLPSSSHRLGKSHLLRRLEQLNRLSKGLVKGDQYIAGLVVEQAYCLAREPGIRSSLTDVLESNHVGPLLVLLGFLGRLKAAHLTFLDITTTIPSFAKVNITFVDCPQAAGRVLENLEQRTEALGDFLLSHRKDLPDWMSAHNNDKMAAFKSQSLGRLNIHAEIQMLFYLSQDQNPDTLPYLGVSKKTCYLCGQFLSRVGRFATRQNHGKIYPQWTLPKQALLDEECTSRIDVAVDALCTLLVDLLGTSSDRTRDMLKESVGDPSTVASLSDPSNMSTDHLRQRAQKIRSRESSARWVESIRLKTDE